MKHNPAHAGLFFLVSLLLTGGSIDPTPPQDSGDKPRDGGFAPQDALARMTLPEGFHAELFASEPEVRQPVAATFDERGRMWVVEYLQYPTPAGVKPVTVDQYLRTEYDKMPDPPPNGPKGADRIKILEDTDGDGRDDKVTTFVDGLNLASGVAVGYGGVFVANAPYLLYYPDKDRNDVPDGPPEVLLRGFGIQDAHAVINSLTWGPDGWLYGAQGSTVTAKVEGYEFQQGIWRFHPVTKKFELFAEGGGNTWGVDFDRAGNLFGSSNGSMIAFHMVQGGYYWKGFAKHGPLHNPRAYGYFNSIEFEGNKPGGHVTPGGIIYKGGAYPKEYDGAFIGPNLLSNSVYWYKLAPKGSTFEMSLGGTLLDSHDRWFRPIDALTSPDGCVYIVDWYDKRASHLDPRDNWDRSNGRIYRIVYGERETPRPFDLSTMSTKDLIALRTHKNAWWPETALRVLFERKDASVVPQLLEDLKNERDETIAMRDLWMLDACGGIGEDVSVTLLGHPIAAVRAWVVRRLGDRSAINREQRDALTSLANDEPAVSVRAQLASSCQRWPHADVISIIRALAQRQSDADDSRLPLLLWWAIERHVRDDPSFVTVVGDTPRGRLRLVKEHLLERLVQAVASRGDFAGFNACNLLLTAPSDAESWRRFIGAFEKAIQGIDPNQVPSALADKIDSAWRVVGPDDLTLLRLNVRLRRASAIERTLARVRNPQMPEAERVSLLEVLGASADERVPSGLLDLMEQEPNQTVAQAAVSALRAFETPDVGTRVIALYRKAPEPLRKRMLDLLCSRKSWARRLVAAVENGLIAAKELSPAQVLLITQQGDTDLNARLETLWGKLPGSGTPEKDHRIAEVRGMLPEGDKGNPQRGRKVYQEQCANCHRLFGEGQAIGPDLSGAERGDLEFLLASVVDPSRVMRKEYQAVTVATKDGRVLTGLIIEQNDQYMVLFDSAQQKTTVPRGEIEEIKDATVSVMPEGLLDKLSEGQIRDLFRYLQSSGQ